MVRSAALPVKCGVHQSVLANMTQMFGNKPVMMPFPHISIINAATHLFIWEFFLVHLLQTQQYVNTEMTKVALTVSGVLV
jgi:hypothetical protein